MDLRHTANPRNTDVLVIGAGLAGLMTALSLAPKKVTLLSKGPLGLEASSTWAQGGISAALAPEDSPASHCADTLAVSGGIADEAVAELVTALGPERIKTLIELGVIFDREGDSLSLSREAAHSHRRVVHANGDSTGREVMRALKARVLAAEHITVLEEAEALDLIVGEGRVGGAFVAQRGQRFPVIAEAVVLATGGIGQIYCRTTNPNAACGDGLAMAARAGAALGDLEFVQFHPTAINVEATPLPLATEALRGEGSLLIDEAGRRFMIEEHPLAELAPRDVVARGIWRQLAAGHSVYLDPRESVGDSFPEHFPTVFAHCRDHGIDPRVEPIPVAPAAHYHMGGVITDKAGRTDLPGLWACGEVACTGLHGANRLASNSLLEALAFAPLVAEDIKTSQTTVQLPTPLAAPLYSAETPDQTAAIALLQALNYRHIGVERDEAGLAALLAELDKLATQHPRPCPRLRNIMTCSRLIAASALSRTESRGGHYRRDYPKSDPALARRSRTTLAATLGESAPQKLRHAS